MPTDFEHLPTRSSRRYSRAIAEIHRHTLGSPNVRIAFLDGQIDTQHACFANANFETHDILTAETSAAALRHGTHVVSVVLGAEQSTFQGLAPQSHGLIIPIFNDIGDNDLASTDQINLARGITIAVENGANIINLSCGQKGSLESSGTYLQDALRLCADHDVLVLAAAGNDGCPCEHLPAAMPGVIAIGACSADGMPLEFSNWGDSYQSKGILAPGNKVLGANIASGFVERTGTSFATAVAAGSAALLWSVALERNYKISAPEISRLLMSTVDPCSHADDQFCARFLQGTLNVDKAYKALVSYLPLRSYSETRYPFQENQESSLHSDVAVQTTVSPQVTYAVTRPPHACETAETMLYQAGKSTSDMPPIVDRPRHSVPAVNLSARSDCGQAATTGWESSEPVVPLGPRQTTMGSDTMTHAASMTETPEKHSPLHMPETSGSSPPPVYPQDCTCGGNCGGESTCSCGQSPAHGKNAYSSQSAEIQKVFAVGNLWYTFESQTQQDALAQAMLADKLTISNTNDIVRFLRENPHHASGCVFTLNDESVPIYAIQPSGPFGLQIYERLIDYLGGVVETMSGDLGEQGRYLSRVSLPGVITGIARLYTGEQVPVVTPDLRALFQWTSTQIRETIAQAMNITLDSQEAETVESFINKVYYELRNLGISSQDRAVNFAATNAFSAAEGIRRAAARKLVLKDVRVRKSPICRPDSDCWDVELRFFDPENLNRAGSVYRQAVDVNRVIPATIGIARAWPAILD